MLPYSNSATTSANSEWFSAAIGGTHKKSLSFADTADMVPGDTTEHTGGHNLVSDPFGIVLRMNVAPATVGSVDSLPLCRSMYICVESNLKLSRYAPTTDENKILNVTSPIP